MLNSGKYLLRTDHAGKLDAAAGVLPETYQVLSCRAFNEYAPRHHSGST